MTGRGGTFEVVEHRGERAGPTVALLGGIHGDEDEGVLAVQRVSAALRAAPLERGAVRAVAVAHPAAYAAARRESPLDGLNLARCFPGDPAGSATERLARELTDRVIAGSDLLIDLHSAGVAYAMPTFAGCVGGDDEVAARSRRAAVAFGAPLLWEHPPPVAPGRTLSAALALGIPCIYAEGSGGGSVEADELAIYVEGVLAVLADLAMIPPRGDLRPRRVIRGGGGDLDRGLTAAAAGRFLASRRAGDVLAAGEAIGELLDEDGAPLQSVRAPADATLVFLRRAARVAAGDVLCAFGAPAVDWSGA